MLCEGAWLRFLMVQIAQHVLIQVGGRYLPPVFSKNENNFPHVAFTYHVPSKVAFSLKMLIILGATQIRT